jgi:hypothetical protein
VGQLTACRTVEPPGPFPSRRRVADRPQRGRRLHLGAQRQAAIQPHLLARGAEVSRRQRRLRLRPYPPRSNELLVVPHPAKRSGLPIGEVVVLIEPHATRCHAAVPVEHRFVPQPGAAVRVHAEIIHGVIALRRPGRIVVQAAGGDELVEPDLLGQPSRLVDTTLVMREDEVLPAETRQIAVQLALQAHEGAQILHDAIEPAAAPVDFVRLLVRSVDCGSQMGQAGLDDGADVVLLQREAQVAREQRHQPFAVGIFDQPRQFRVEEGFPPVVQLQRERVRRQLVDDRRERGVRDVAPAAALLPASGGTERAAQITLVADIDAQLVRARQQLRPPGLHLELDEHIVHQTPRRDATVLRTHEPHAA